MKTMKSSKEEARGIAEIGHMKISCTADIVLWRPLLLGCHKDLREERNLKKSAEQSGI